MSEAAQCRWVLAIERMFIDEPPESRIIEFTRLVSADLRLFFMGPDSSAIAFDLQFHW